MRTAEFSWKSPLRVHLAVPVNWNHRKGEKSVSPARTCSPLGSFPVVISQANRLNAGYLLRGRAGRAGQPRNIWQELFIGSREDSRASRASIGSKVAESVGVAIGGVNFSKQEWGSIRVLFPQGEKQGTGAIRRWMFEEFATRRV